mmetsp:Transcript_14410/g.39179  ORF Transcript_14410/g.39179 Transcript_14410/m.39179 type:complete len:219 (+) Transcript_14410:750-1406(+)
MPDERLCQRNELAACFVRRVERGKEQVPAIVNDGHQIFPLADQAGRDRRCELLNPERHLPQHKCACSDGREVLRLRPPRLHQDADESDDDGHSAEPCGLSKALLAMASACGQAPQQAVVTVRFEGTDVLLGLVGRPQKGAPVEHQLVEVASQPLCLRLEPSVCELSTDVPPATLDWALAAAATLAGMPSGGALVRAARVAESAPVSVPAVGAVAAGRR